MSEGTVLDKATLLSQRLDRLAEYKDKANETDWLPQQISNMREALNALRAQLALARSVNNVVGSAQIDLTNVSAGFINFKKRADDDASYPSKESWRTALKHIKAAVDTIAERRLSTWQTWAEARLAELSTDRINLIRSEPRKQAAEQLAALRRMATARTIEPGHVARFPQMLSTLRTLLESAPTMSPEVASVLKLFELLDTVTLRDLTNEQIDELRQSELDQRIVLHWKDV